MERHCQHCTNFPRSRRKEAIYANAGTYEKNWPAAAAFRKTDRSLEDYEQWKYNPWEPNPNGL